MRFPLISKDIQWLKYYFKKYICLQICFVQMHLNTWPILTEKGIKRLIFEMGCPQYMLSAVCSLYVYKPCSPAVSCINNQLIIITATKACCSSRTLLIPVHSTENSESLLAFSQSSSGFLVTQQLLFSAPCLIIKLLAWPWHFSHRYNRLKPQIISRTYCIVLS